MRSTLALHERAQYFVAVSLGLGAALLALASVDGLGPLARPQFSLVTSLPVPVFIVGAAGLGAVALSRRSRWGGLALFFAWLPFEDLVRKFAGNDLKVYFVKDALLLTALVGLMPHLRGCWRRPLGSAWRPLLLVITVALLYSLPTGIVAVSIPLVGLHQKFLFALLFPVGALLARDRAQLERTMFALALLSAGVCLIGLLQVFFLGPAFLNPQVADPFLQHLTVIKSVGLESILRPSGPFADVSRFSSMTIVAVLLGFCALRMSASAVRQRISLACVIVSLSAAFVSGSRTALLISIPIVIYGAASTWRRTRTYWGVGVAIATALTFSLGSGVVAETTATTATFYQYSLNPASENFEAGTRVRYYALDALRGATAFGLIGRGTGDQSTGRRYLAVSDSSEAAVESGWASLAIEWGLLGLGIWLVWATVWMARAVRLARSDPSGPAGPIRGLVAFYVVSLLTVQFSLGAGFFENYIANIFFWFLSGVAFAGYRPPGETASQVAPAYQLAL